MEKEEILEKSRNENKNQDLVEVEIIKKSSSISLLVVSILCTIFTIFEVHIGAKGYFAFQAIMFATVASQYIYKSVKLKRKSDIICAILESIATISFTIMYIYDMIKAYVV